MLVGIHDLGRYDAFNGPYRAILAHNGIQHVGVNINDPRFWDQVRAVDLFVFRFNLFNDLHQIAATVIPIIDREFGVRCFPDWNTCWHYDDKIKQAYLLQQHGFPAVRTWVFFNRSAALEWVQSAELPVVFKLKGGAGSSNVSLLHTRGQAQSAVRTMFGRGVRPGRRGYSDVKHHEAFLRRLYVDARRRLGASLRREDPSPFWQVHKNYVLFQEFLPGNAFDTRVTVIGERAFAFRRLVRPNDFRASGSGKIDHDPGPIDSRCVRLALDISQKLHFQTMAYDFLFNRQGEPEICEISCMYADWAVQACPGYWDASLNWVEGHYWPQYCILVDALGLPDMKQPELSH